MNCEFYESIDTPNYWSSTWKTSLEKPKTGEADNNDPLPRLRETHTHQMPGVCNRY